MLTSAPSPPTLCRPPLEEWPPAGVYQLWLRVPVAQQLVVGRLGRCCLPAGLYVYTGRAARGPAARVRRHLRRTPRPHWHIDYLLARPAIRIAAVTLASTRPEDECRLNRALGGSAVVPGFGASDCRAGCRAHLLRIGPADAPLPPVE